MSITSQGRGKGKTNKREPIPASSPPRPFIVKKLVIDPDQLQLGNITLASVDHLTGMTADEIERVAEQVLDGAEVTAAALRELAWRVHESGILASERLGHFVRVANQFADVARSMQQSLVRRDQAPPENPAFGLAEVDDAPGLDAVEQQMEERINGTRNEVAPRSDGP